MKVKVKENESGCENETVRARQNPLNESIPKKLARPNTARPSKPTHGLVRDQDGARRARQEVQA